MGLQRHRLHLLKSVSYSKARKRGEGREQTRNRAGRGDGEGRGESRNRRADLKEGEEQESPPAFLAQRGAIRGPPGLVPDLPTACPPRSSGPVLHPPMSQKARPAGEPQPEGRGGGRTDATEPVGSPQGSPAPPQPRASAGARVDPATPEHPPPRCGCRTPFSSLFLYVLFTRVCPVQVASQDIFYPLSYCCKNGFSCIIHDLSIPRNIRCTWQGGECWPRSARLPSDLQ